MSDDERIERLTELARRIDARAVLVPVGPTLRRDTAGWAVLTMHDEAVIAQAMGAHALDALEAALRVLAGEPLDRVHMPCNARICILEAKLARFESTDWVEQLAAEWVERANDWPPFHERRIAFKDCAAELRARAKGGER